MNSLNHSLNIAIIGAGIAGLASALTLIKAGYSVQVFEKKSQLQELGAGIQLSPNATSILESWNLLEKIKTQSFEPKGVCFSHWKRGYAFANFPLNKSLKNNTRTQNPYLHIHRSDLHRCLADALLAISSQCIFLDREVINIEEKNQTCVVDFKNAQQHDFQESFDYVIGADGIRSSVKKLLHPQLSKPRFTGNIAWRGLIPTSKLKNKPEQKAHLVMAPNAHLVFYYVKGGEYLNYIAVKEIAVTSTNEPKEESWSHKGSKSELLEDFKDWHSTYLDILAESDPDNCYRWALYDRDPLPTWSTKRSLLIGDAAHPVLPFLAQGAALALEDAAALEAVFNEKNFKEIGKQFFELRSIRCQAVLEASRKNMQLYHEPTLLKREIRDLGLGAISKLNPNFLEKKLSWLYYEK